MIELIVEPKHKTEERIMQQRKLCLWEKGVQFVLNNEPPLRVAVPLLAVASVIIVGGVISLSDRVSGILLAAVIR